MFVEFIKFIIFQFIAETAIKTIEFQDFTRKP